MLTEGQSDLTGLLLSRACCLAEPSQEQMENIKRTFALQHRLKPVEAHFHESLFVQLPKVVTSIIHINLSDCAAVG